MNSFQYLRELHKVYKTKDILNKIFIIGNTTCDLDSVLSAYLLSIARNIRSGLIEIDDSNSATINDQAKDIYLPVLNCARGQYKSRLDGQIVFKKFNLNDEDFFYRDDPEFSEEAFIESNKKGSANIIIVDHSILDNNQKVYANYVIELYDHHMSLLLEYPNLRRKTIKYPCGSCSTLILVDYFLSKFPHSIISPLLASTAILIDTENFKEEFFESRWSEIDKMAYNHIMNQIQSKIYMDHYFSLVYGTKFNAEANLALGVDGIMEKDRKNFNWNNVLTEWSSMQISFNQVIKHFGLKSITDYFDKYEGKIHFYLGNSQIETGHNLFFIYSFNHFKGFDFKKFEEFIKKAKGEQLLAFSIEEDGKIIKIILSKTQTRKLVEPFFRLYFLENPMNENL